MNTLKRKLSWKQETRAVDVDQGSHGDGQSLFVQPQQIMNICLFFFLFCDSWGSPPDLHQREGLVLRGLCFGSISFCPFTPTYAVIDPFEFQRRESFETKTFD